MPPYLLALSLNVLKLILLDCASRSGVWLCLSNDVVVLQLC